MNIGFTEILFILGLALVFFGPKKLPQAAREWGRTIYRLKADLKKYWDRGP
ncbi:MAG: twin-arginine translocase TatA/TatE family subunit [Deltaproteobacteria bacterium]|nr:twin-arginine translocase TatA/TatE family subunit [Deltaproteobacteria bacterium]